jgi:hypothetical protein
VLFDLIPENRLQETFERAFSTHDSSFPVSAYDLKDAWKAIADEERLNQPVSIDRYIPIPIKYCAAKGSHINDRGDIITDLRGAQIEVPCPTCRPLWHKERMAELESHEAFESAAVN